MTSPFSERLFKDKHVFVAGGSSGINLRIAQRYAEAGARLSIFSRDPAKIDAAVASIVDAGGSASGYTGDVRSYEAVEAALETAAQTNGEIDVVISGAAGNFVAPAATMSSNGFRAVVDIDLVGTFHVFRAAYGRLRRPGASLIAITAPQSRKPSMLQAHVCAAKAGIDMLVKVLALEWGNEGIRVNAISPGPIADTEGMARLAPNEAAAAAIRASLALGRYGEKDEIADAAFFLSSDAGRYVTGTILDCDGGTMLGSAVPELGAR
ncbi:SDR family oxidoreductase [Sphingopyxis fribergensis]